MHNTNVPRFNVQIRIENNYMLKWNLEQRIQITFNNILLNGTGTVLFNVLVFNQANLPRLNRCRHLFIFLSFPYFVTFTRLLRVFVVRCPLYVVHFLFTKYKSSIRGRKNECYSTNSIIHLFMSIRSFNVCILVMLLSSYTWQVCFFFFYIHMSMSIWASTSSSRLHLSNRQIHVCLLMFEFEWKARKKKKKKNHSSFGMKTVWPQKSPFEILLVLIELNGKWKRRIRWKW